MNDIFISYKKEDADRVRLLVKALEREGFSIWWDPTIPPGSTWAQVIEQAIKTCKVVLVVWSKLSATSDWVQKEARKGESRGILVPVVIDDVEIPFEFEHIQGARLVGWDGAEPNEQFRQLIHQIRERIEAAAEPGDAAAQSEERQRRRAAALRSLLARRAGAAFGIVGFAVLLAAYFLGPTKTVEVQLRNLNLAGARFALPGADAAGVQLASGTSNPAILVFDQLPMRNLVVFGLKSARIPAAEGGAPQSIGDDPVIELGTVGEGSMILSALKLPPGASVELQQLQSSHEMVVYGASDDLVVDLNGRIVVSVESEDTLDFSVPRRLVLSPDPDGLNLDFELTDEEIPLFENLGISDLRLYRVDQDVTLEGTDVSRVSTIRGGTLSANWLSEPRELVEGEGLRFASFAGEIQRLLLTESGLILNATGQVTGLRSSLTDEEPDMMPTRLAALSGITRWLVIAGAVTGLGVLGFVNLRLWRRTL